MDHKVLMRDWLDTRWRNNDWDSFPSSSPDSKLLRLVPGGDNQARTFEEALAFASEGKLCITLDFKLDGQQRQQMIEAMMKFHGL